MSARLLIIYQLVSWILDATPEGRDWVDAIGFMCARSGV
jgi:hypothetical protein